MCANLPYVPSGDLPGWRRSSRSSRRSALDGGADGLDVVRRLIDRLPRSLEPGGVAFLEIGADQGDAVVREVAARIPGAPCTVTPDLAGHPRLARVDLPLA